MCRGEWDLDGSSGRARELEGELEEWTGGAVLISVLCEIRSEVIFWVSRRHRCMRGLRAAVTIWEGFRKG